MMMTSDRDSDQQHACDVHVISSLVALVLASCCGCCCYSYFVCM